MPRKHYDEELAQHQEGLLDVIQRAGINVLWNDNDGGCKGACDRVPHQNMTALNLPGQCINGECYDEVLFHGLEDYINNLQGDGVIVLHTIGSHGPTYFNRYPPQFRKFTPTCDTNEIQTCSQEQLVNTYDNTLVYVDYIVDKAINLLKAHQDKFTTSLVYLSDHGESLGITVFTCMGCHMPSPRMCKNRYRCCSGCQRTIKNAMVSTRVACKNRPRHSIIRRTIYSQPCWDLRAYKHRITRPQMIFCSNAGETLDENLNC